jgi:hypothetical protein
MVLQDARRIQALGIDIKTLDRSINATAANSALARTLQSIPGFGDTTTAELAGEIGTLSRFESEAGLALYTGMAALDNSSGKKTGARTPRQVNTRAKAAVMVAIARHLPHVPASRAYYDKKRAEGKKTQSGDSHFRSSDDSRDLGDGQTRTGIRNSIKNCLKILAGCSGQFETGVRSSVVALPPLYSPHVLPHSHRISQRALSRHRAW